MKLFIVNVSLLLLNSNSLLFIAQLMKHQPYCMHYLALKLVDMHPTFIIYFFNLNLFYAFAFCVLVSLVFSLMQVFIQTTVYSDITQSAKQIGPDFIIRTLVTHNHIFTNTYTLIQKHIRILTHVHTSTHTHVHMHRCIGPIPLPTWQISVHLH